MNSERIKILKNVNELVEESKKIGKKCREAGISETQMKKFLHGVKKLTPGSIAILKVHLAYAISRNPKAKILMDEIEPYIDAISKEKDDRQKEMFENFKKFVEGIIAYYLFYGKSRGGE